MPYKEKTWLKRLKPWRMTTLLYADDDLVVISRTKAELQNMMSTNVEVGRRYRMETNIDRSKMTRI